MLTMEHTSWATVAGRIRDQRAERRCECTGRCGVRHNGGRCGTPHGTNPQTGAFTVLTVTQLDRDPGNTADSNLVALCHPCQSGRTRATDAAVEAGGAA